MLITLFSVVAMKSRTFSGFSYSAHEQACRSWEGAQPGRAELASGNIPYPGHHARCMNGVGQGEGRNPFFPLISRSLNPHLSGTLNFSGILIFFP